jgi:hypothetical protein
MVWTRKSEFNNLVPKHAQFIHSEFEMIGRAECVMRCALNKPACLEVFYNNLKGSCKLVKSNVMGTLAYDVQIGWECLAGYGKHE